MTFDLGGALDGGEAELRGGGTEVGVSAGGAVEVGGEFGAAAGTSLAGSDGLGLDTGAADFVEFLAAKATPTMAVSVAETRSPSCS